MKAGTTGTTHSSRLRATADLNLLGIGCGNVERAPSVMSERCESAAHTLVVRIAVSLQTNQKVLHNFRRRASSAGFQVTDSLVS